MLKYIVPTLILIALAGVSWLIMSNPPTAQRSGPPTGPQMSVETIQIKPMPYEIKVESYGTVQPQTQSMLVSQVSGQIISLQPKFAPGGSFNAGDVLLEIDPRDYEADVKIAQANLMDARQAEAQEVARAEQALVDWQRLGQVDEEPSDLVLRKPQLLAAQARAISAQAGLSKAQLELERATLRAPYDGRVLQRLVDLGQVVGNGAAIAEIYATDYVEIRLPLRNTDLAFIELPEQTSNRSSPVTIRSELGDKQRWQGEIVRTEAAIDETSRQLHVVAQIKSPFAAATQQHRRPLKIGEYVTATLSGKQIAHALVIPIEAVYQNTYVYVVEDNLLQRRNVQIDWQNGQDAVIGSGLQAGDMLVTTPLGQVTSGTPVRIRQPSLEPSGATL